jgi:hypothetical protein
MGRILKVKKWVILTIMFKIMIDIDLIMHLIGLIRIPREFSEGDNIDFAGTLNLR